MAPNIRTGIIGFGLSGRVFHAPFIDIVDGFELSMISTSCPERANFIEERYPQTEIVSDAKEIILNPKIDLVIVASPNTHHFYWAREALKAGKHVVVEKPFTITVAEADELILLAQKSQKVLTVYHNRRFTSDTKTVKKILDSGLLGNITDYETHFDRYRPAPKTNAWREESLSGSGVFYDLGAHLIDQALFFFGMPQSVTADITISRSWAKVDDTFDVRLHYPSFTATLKSGSLCKIPGPTYQIHGDNGSFVKYGLDVQEAALNNGAIPKGCDWGREPEAIWGTVNVEYKCVKINGKVESEHGDYRDYFVNLRDAIHGKTVLAVKPEEARDVMRIIERAIQSNEEKRTIFL